MIKDLENEEWRDVHIVKGVDFSGYYKASNKGRIKRLEGTVTYRNGRNKHIKEHLLNPKPEKRTGRLHVYLSNGKEHITGFFHQFLAATFIPNPNNYPFVNHKDENPSNNCVENLEWCTKYYNDNYGTARERAWKTMSIPVVQLNIDGSFVKEWQSATKAEEAGFGCATIINRCVKKKLKSHYGYLWLYSDEYNKMSKEELNEYVKWTENTTYKKDKRVVQLNMDGSLVKIWNQVSDVSKKDMSVTTVSNCINKKYKNAYGYIWFRYLEYINFSDSELKEKVEYANIDTQKIPVVQLSMDDKLIKVWDSAKDAAKDNDFCASTISAVCKHKNGRTQHKGYKWMYLSDYERIK